MNVFAPSVSGVIGLYGVFSLGKLTVDLQLYEKNNNSGKIQFLIEEKKCQEIIYFISERTRTIPATPKVSHGFTGKTTTFTWEL